MFRKEVKSLPLVLWILAGMSAPVVQLLAGFDWKGMALLGLLSTAVVLLGYHAGEYTPKWLAVLQALWILPALVTCSRITSLAWPMAETKLAVPLVLLAVSAWAADRGPWVGASMAGILFILICIGYGSVAVAGIPQMQLSWAVSHSPVPLALGTFVFLLSGVASAIPKEKGKAPCMLLLIPVFAVLISLITCANVYPGQGGNSAFYQMSRSLSFFGLTERFEALVCALITVGWFALITLLLSTLGSWIQKVFPGKGKMAVWIAAVLGSMGLLFNLTIPMPVLAMGAIIFWGLIPVLSQVIGLAKKGVKK